MTKIGRRYKSLLFVGREDSMSLRDCPGARVKIAARGPVTIKSGVVVVSLRDRRGVEEGLLYSSSRPFVLSYVSLF